MKPPRWLAISSRWPNSTGGWDLPFFTSSACGPKSEKAFSSCGTPPFFDEAAPHEVDVLVEHLHEIPYLEEFGALDRREAPRPDRCLGGADALAQPAGAAEQPCGKLLKGLPHL